MKRNRVIVYGHRLRLWYDQDGGFIGEPDHGEDQFKAPPGKNGGKAKGHVNLPYGGALRSVFLLSMCFSFLSPVQSSSISSPILIRFGLRLSTQLSQLRLSLCFLRLIYFWALRRTICVSYLLLCHLMFRTLFVYRLSTSNASDFRDRPNSIDLVPPVHSPRRGS